MSEVLKKEENISLNSYFEKNREKIDEAIVSLRLMKEVDDFMENNHVKQREFADKLGYSEAYVSQLMTGSKKFNTSFINKLEKAYDLVVKFKIEEINKNFEVSKISNSLGEFYYKSSDDEIKAEMNYFFKINNQNFMKVDFEGEFIDFVEVD